MRGSAALLIILASCAGSGGAIDDASGTAAGAVRTVAPLPRHLISPLAEHHEHVLSPRGPQEPEQILPAVALPADLAAVLRGREALSGTSSAGQLFAPEGQIVQWGSPSRWVRGREAVGQALQGFTPGYRYVANAYSLEGGVASVSGVTARGEMPNLRFGTNFAITMRKDPLGRWQIVSEILSPRNVPAPEAGVSGDEVIAEMDDAGIGRAALISSAHTFGSPLGPLLPPEEEYARVRAENDYAASQVARFPERLFGFCAVNPLRDWAEREIERCAAKPEFVGIKLHFFTAQVDLTNAAHVERLRAVFRAANARDLALLVHILHRPTVFGAGHARIFLEEVLGAAPDVPVQLAHLSLSYDNEGGADAAIGIFADAITARDPRTRNLYFDTSASIYEATSPEEAALIIRRIRQIGTERILFGSDSGPGFPRASVAWADLRWRLALTDDELRAIADNVAPYMVRRRP